MDLGKGPRYLNFVGATEPILAAEVRLNDDDRIPGTFGWLTRFSVVTTGESEQKWPTVNALYVEGILDGKGDWQADFPEPTKDDPIRF